MKKPYPTRFTDPVARFLEWMFIRAHFFDFDDSAMRKAYPKTAGDLKSWKRAFSAVPDDHPARFLLMEFCLSADGTPSQSLNETTDDIVNSFHYQMAVQMPWTAAEGQAWTHYKNLEKLDGWWAKGEASMLPKAVVEWQATNNNSSGKKVGTLFSKMTGPRKEIAQKAIEQIADNTWELPSSKKSFAPAITEADDTAEVTQVATTRKSAKAPVSKSKQRQEASVEQQAPSAKAFTVEQALLNPKASKDRSKYKSAYFLWGQIKSHHNVGERFKLTETQASTWAGVAKGQHTKDVVKVLVDVRAIERIKRTLDYRRLV